MKLLLEKIRKILRDRRARQMLTRIVSSLAAVVVFITTYALVLPAITMESQAACGIPAHQHDDSCYEEVLVCGLEESEEHQHDASCYEKQLICGMEAHTHSAACYSQASGEGDVGAGGGTGGAGSSAEDYAVVAATTEALNDAVSGADNTDAGASGTDIAGTSVTGDGSADVTDVTDVTDATVDAGTDLSALSASEDAYVPELEALFFDQLLTKKTGIYYFHPEEGDTIPESAEDIAAITDWTRVDEDTDLDPNDILRVYLRYTIPAGALNSTNPVARYRLPANLHLTDQQLEEINTTVNGIANQYINLDTLEILDPDQYNQYLGIEVVEGTRTPSDDINEYFAKHPDMNGQEYISAVVRAENVYDTEGLYGEKDAYLGQDLIFTFTPYTVQKNQNEYDADGQPTKAGEKVNGWLCLDLNMDQVDWDEPAVTTEEKDGAKTSNTDASDANVDETTESASVHKTLIEQKESNADILFVAEDKSLKIDEISTNLRMIEQTEINPEGNDDADKDQDEENAATVKNGDESDLAAASADADTEKTKQASPDEKTGEDGAEGTNDAAASTDTAIEINVETYPAASFEDSIVVHAGSLSTDNESATKDTPEETTIAVSVTADAETFPRGTTMVLGAVDDMDTVASAVEGAVEGRTRGFHAVDISFIDPDGNEIEPLKPIKVSMTSDAIKQAVEDSSTVPVVVHVENSNSAASSAADDSAPADPVAADPATADSASANSAAKDSVEVDAASHTDVDAAAGNDLADGSNAPLQTEATSSAPVATIVETNETTSTDNSADQKEAADTLSFDAGSFSVYAIVYTVDFHWEVDGKTYDFSIPGGGFVSLEHLVEALGIGADNTSSVIPAGEADHIEVKENAANRDGTSSAKDEAVRLNAMKVSETTKKFVSEVEKLEFSNPDLVWTGKIDKAVTVGDLKKSKGLEAEYSADLTQEQIAEIKAQTVAAGDWALISVQPFTSEETLTVTMKNGEVFTVKVTDAQIVERYLSDKGELYEVTVTYGLDAKIPDGSSLRVTEFKEGSQEYIDVKNAVIADKQAKGEALDFTDLAALDISIMDPSGKEIEPAAPVTVQMSILKLPGVEDLGTIASTLKVKHHVETENGVVVETVYSGSTEAEFVMETDEAVAAAGTAVDPATADPAAIDFSSTKLYPDGSAVPNTVEEQGQLNVTFETPVFSSFTVQWNTGGGGINTMASINWSNGLAYLAYVPYAQVNIHYVNQNGLPIARPSSVGDIDRGDLVSVEHSYNIEYTFGKPITGFTYQGAHFGSYSGETVTDVTLRGNPGFFPVVWNGDVTFYNGSTQVSQMGANGVGFATVVPSADIYLVYSGESNTPHATVHYVDEEGNELTVVNGTPVSDTAERTIYPNRPYTYGAYTHNYNYLIYDVDGYEYDYTYRNTNDQSHRITPVLNYYQNRWKYTKGTNQYGINSWSNLESGDEIYVVYKKRKDPPSGGTPLPVDTENAKLDPATITKSSKVNGDGTNTLALSVTGHAKGLETKKMADVIVIYDVSGSMKYRMASEDNPGYGEKSRMEEAEAATKALAHTLLGERNTKEYPDLIRMALVSFSNTAQIVQGFTNNETEFSKAVDRLQDPEGGTNWEHALQIANEMSVASDRATFVIFVTDGNPTFRLARQVLNNGGTRGLGDNDVMEYFFKYLVYGHGNSDEWARNYAGALAQVRAIVGSNKHFYTVGIGPEDGISNLTNLLNDADVPADHGHTATNSQQLSEAFADIGARIIGTLGHSSISISDGITDLTQIVKKTNLVSNDAFKEDDFTYWKGRVDHLATQADVNSGKAAKVGDPVVLDSAWTEWDPATEKCEKAKYENGAVVWNMGDKFMPEEGYTYQVRFNVWPSQQAYDLLAELNNADDPAAAYAALSPDVQSQIQEPKEAGQPYTLKTNDETSYSYKEATRVEGIVTPLPDTGANGSFDEVDPLHLTTSPLKLQKKFDYNYVDTRKPEESITLELYSKTEDGQWAKTFKTMTLDAVYQKDDDGNYIDAEGRVLHEEGGTYYDADNIERERVLVEDESWYSDDNFVSYGLLTYDENDPSGTKKVYETGHDFTLRETGINAHYYELEAGTYRPMYINGTPTVLEQVEKPVNMAPDAFYYSEGGTDYYQLDGKYYKDTGSDVIMSALNKHRSYMDLTKVVEGVAAANDEFEYRITFTVPENIENYERVEQYIWFSVYNPSDRRTLAPSEYTYSGAMTADRLDEILESDEYSGPEYANYLVATSGQPFTLKIKESWNVRFLNLPIGTTYAFEEVNIPEGYSFVSAAVSGTVWPNTSTTGPASNIDASKLPTNDGTSIGGTIELANARYKTTYTNRTLTQKIDIKKTRQNGTTPLEGAEFILYTKAGYEADPKISSRSDLVSGEDGIIPLGHLAAGEYRLVETKAPEGFILLTEPITITVNPNQTVTYTQPGLNVGLSGNGISGDVSSGYQLTVINDEGAALPSTGGPGTTLIYLLGFMLTAFAGAALMIKSSRRKSAA